MWWQMEAMFSLKQGMHTLYQKPSPSTLQQLGIPANSKQTAFYDEIIKFHLDASVPFHTEFHLRTKIVKIEQKNGKSEYNFWAEAPIGDEAL